VLAKVFDQGHLFHHLLDRGYIFFDSLKVILGKEFKQEENKDLYLKASPPNALKPRFLQEILQVLPGKIIVHAIFRLWLSPVKFELGMQIVIWRKDTV
jgi:hypothetical protein